jgi:hypothetical protein
MPSVTYKTFILRVVMLNGVMLDVVMPSVVVLNVVMLSIVVRHSAYGINQLPDSVARWLHGS